MREENSDSYSEVTGEAPSMGGCLETLPTKIGIRTGKPGIPSSEIS